MSASRKRKLQVAPAADEQSLIAAYRKMDNRARCNTLRIALRTADEWPALGQSRVHHAIMLTTQADEQAVLRNFRSMSMDARDTVCRMVASIAQGEAERSERQPLRLVIGGRS